MALTHWHKPAEFAARKADKQAVKTAIPSLDAYALIKNPSSKQVEEALNLLAATIAHDLRATT